MPWIPVKMVRFHLRVPVEETPQVRALLRRYFPQSWNGNSEESDKAKGVEWFYIETQPEWSDEQNEALGHYVISQEPLEEEYQSIRVN